MIRELEDGRWEVAGVAIVETREEAETLAFGDTGAFLRVAPGELTQLALGGLPRGGRLVDEVAS